jgi:FkbM family methyltransferase
VSTDRELDELLAEDVSASRDRAASAFDRARGDRPVVLVGAGNLGRRIATALRDAGITPVAFADADPHLAGARVAGVPVSPLDDVIERHRAAAFVVTIWGARSAHRIGATERALRAAHTGAVIPFVHVMWRLPATLPHYLLDMPDGVLASAHEIRRAFAVLADDASRREFVAQVRARLTGRVDELPEPVPGPAYIPGPLVAPREGERFVDGGAFDGDTLADWRAARGDDYAAWIACEPHPENASAFERTLAAVPGPARGRVTLVRAALGASAGVTRFGGAGGAGASGNATGGVERPVVALDDVPDAAAATYIKLDIEGDELRALEGMRGVVARQRPVLAVCAYHRQDHLWRVPLALASMCRDAQLHLRAHGAEGWDLVCYAVPVDRGVG